MVSQEEKHRDGTSTAIDADAVAAAAAAVMEEEYYFERLLKEEALNL